jgi:REP element-mobilizing transposase RayT
MNPSDGWHSRGYLPHYDPGRVPQFVTWRLDDALPVELYERWKNELVAESDERRKLELYRRAEKYLDAGHGACVLRELTRRKNVGDAIRFYHGSRYDLHAFVVMPNHVHILITPNGKLGAIIGSLKSYTSREIHRLFGGEGALWQPDYFDRAIRSEEHFHRVKKYIEWYPVKAGLVFDPRHWQQSSACGS